MTPIEPLSTPGLGWEDCGDIHQNIGRHPSPSSEERIGMGIHPTGNRSEAVRHSQVLGLVTMR